VWLGASDQVAITKASNDIDLVLETFPNSAGIPSFDTVRLLTMPPLGVEFEVDDVNRQVMVLSVWDTDKGRPSPTGN